jgi:hypothetical protein
VCLSTFESVLASEQPAITLHRTRCFRLCSGLLRAPPRAGTALWILAACSPDRQRLGDSSQEAPGPGLRIAQWPFHSACGAPHLAGVVLGVCGSVNRVNYDFFIGRPMSRLECLRTAPVEARFILSASI